MRTARNRVIINAISVFSRTILIMNSPGKEMEAEKIYVKTEYT